MWTEHLRQAVEAEGVRRVAERLGYSPAAVCQALNGTYGASTERIQRRVEAVLGVVACPHLGAVITAGACLAYRERPLPGHSPSALAHFRACQTCPLNPLVHPKETTHA